MQGQHVGQTGFISLWPHFSDKVSYELISFVGLIHANHGGEITEYLLNQLKDASTDVSSYIDNYHK